MKNGVKRVSIRIRTLASLFLGVFGRLWRQIPDRSGRGGLFSKRE
jgi:hypothetical protein